jgi:hypothetical protein
VGHVCPAAYFLSPVCCGLVATAGLRSRWLELGAVIEVGGVALNADFGVEGRTVTILPCHPDRSDVSEATKTNFTARRGRHPQRGRCHSCSSGDACEVPRRSLFTTRYGRPIAI